MTAALPATRVRVWTRPVRIAHWSIAAIVIFNLFEESRDDLHRWAGYAAAAAVALRLLYGLIYRSGAARLSWPSLQGMLSHWREMRTGHVTRTAGHNPLGTAMALVLWSLVLLLALSGWISQTDRFWGEDWPVDLHTWLADALLVCVIVHLTGGILTSILERQNLIFSMITGRKYVDASADRHASEPKFETHSERGSALRREIE